VLINLRNGSINTSNAYNTLRTLDDVGHFGAMQSLQLAALMGLISLDNITFGCTSSEGGFKTYDFLKNHSIEFNFEQLNPTRKQRDEAAGAAMNNLEKSLSAVGYGLANNVVEQLCCLFARRDNVDKQGLPREIVRYDLIFESMDGIVQNFYRSDKEHKELLYLVRNKWCSVADFVVPWYVMDTLRNESSPVIKKGGIQRQPFILSGKND
jgi:hypothetical protein